MKQYHKLIIVCSLFACGGPAHAQHVPEEILDSLVTIGYTVGHHSGEYIGYEWAVGTE